MRVAANKQPPTISVGKKAQLLRQKILTNASIIHNSYQYRIEELARDQEEAEARLATIMEEFQNKVRSLGQKYQQDVQQLGFYYENYSVNTNDTQVNSVCRQSLTCQRIKNYLNTEKGLLKQILDQKQQPLPSQKANIHDLVRKKHLEEILETVQLFQLEKQVKYLSTHVINSSGIIYVPENQISDAEEDELNSKIQIHLAEVTRLVGLQSMCEGPRSDQNTKDKSNIFNVLEGQQKRLAKVFDMLTVEKEAIRKRQVILDEYMEKVKDPPKYHSPQLLGRKYLARPILKGLNLGQIDSIMNNAESHEQAVGNQTCLHEQLSQGLKHLRNKLKKMQ